jgi:hypothetical protein
MTTNTGAVKVNDPYLRSGVRRLDRWPMGRVAFSLFGLLVGVTTGCIIAQVPGVDCGVNAYDYGGACACIANYDGDPYEACEPLLDVVLTDLCDDGLDIEWRVFAEGREWVWPDSGHVFVTSGFDVDVVQSLQCQEGESLCFGAAAGDQSWGLGLDGFDGGGSCSDCCFDCGAYQFDLGYLTCD